MSFDGKKGLRTFACLIAALFVLRIVLGFVLLPLNVAVALDFVVTVVFVSVPIIALFKAAFFEWTPKIGAVFLVCGGLVHALCVVLLQTSLGNSGFAFVFAQSLVQAAIPVWTLGLGALVASLVKDKNLIVPFAAVLAGLDMFLVFNPDAPTSKAVRQNPALFHSLAYNVPAARVAAPSQPEGAMVVPMAFVGPADLLFIAAFFVLLTRFQMKTKETVKWLAPVMVVYLALVMAPRLGLNMLPALVPIGATVLIVNRKEFSMSKEETVMTWGAVIVALALATTGLVKHFQARAEERPAGRERPVVGQEPQGQATTPVPTSEGRSQS